MLHEDRHLDPDPTVRRLARAIHAVTRGLPIVSPHGHVEAKLLADDEPFPEPTALLLTPDHYLLRMLHSQGVSLESLGVAPLDGGAYERDPRAAWRRFAAHYHFFLGTPSAAWLDYELHEVFGVRQRLDGGTAATIYDEIREKLASPEFRPRALFDRFNIEVLATTDAATDSLEHHDRIRSSGWNGRVIPTFRPDALFKVSHGKWRAEAGRLSKATGIEVTSAGTLVSALESRRAFFKSKGATATDHGTMRPFAARLSTAEADAVVARALAGEATADDERRLEAHLLMEMARLSSQDGLVMQLHAGAWRDHDRALRARFGPDRGGDIPIATEHTAGLHDLLNQYGDNPGFRLVAFTLDESTYARELAPLAGHYPALRLGAPWWFHDSLEGMARFRSRTLGTAGVWNTVGFTDDTRAFCSIPARHDLSRRADANWLAGLVARHVIDLDDAHVMARALAVDLAREAYRL